MSQAEVVIASRFHNLICALRLGQPTVSVGYAGKSRVLMGAVGAGAYCQDIETLDAKLLVAQVAAARQDAEALRETIGQTTPGTPATSAPSWNGSVERTFTWPRQLVIGSTLAVAERTRDLFLSP